MLESPFMLTPARFMGCRVKYAYHAADTTAPRPIKKYIRMYPNAGI
jgi:hypothetical protein